MYFKRSGLATLTACALLAACGSSDGGGPSTPSDVASGGTGAPTSGDPTTGGVAPPAGGPTGDPAAGPLGPATPTGQAGGVAPDPMAMAGMGGAMQPNPRPTVSGGPTTLPTAKEPCPTLVDGDVTFLGKPVRIWIDAGAAAAADGPLLFYWHGTFSNPNLEAPGGLGPGLDAAVAAGGVVAGFYTSECAGCRTTGNAVWYYEDLDLADEVLACAIEQVGIDTRHIHAAGMSAGGLQTTAMAYARAGYMASVTSYSGGITPFLVDPTLQDPASKVAAMIVHGGTGDNLFLMFQDTSNAFHDDLTQKGLFSFLCNHGGGHTIPSGIGASTWQFFQDHPYGTAPSPYAGGLPAGFPDYCTL